MLDVIENVEDNILIEYGLELIKKYEYFMKEEEKEYFIGNIGSIETDFLGFGNYYAMALKYIEENIFNVKTIVDIGCAWGLFSYMFKDYCYVGIDESCSTFFKYYDNFHYIRGNFPEIVPKGDIFIAFMSLGYNRQYHLGKTNMLFAKKVRDALKEYNFGFTNTDDWVEKILEIDFEKTIIRDNEDRVYFWSKKQQSLNDIEVEDMLMYIVGKK